MTDANQSTENSNVSNEGDNPSNTHHRYENGNTKLVPVHDEIKDTCSNKASSCTERTPGQVCPNPDCHIDQRWEGFRGLACPECGTKLVVACAKCDSGGVERVDGSPRCSEHLPGVVTDGGGVSDHVE